MGQPRTTSEMMIEAHRRASRYAPLPEWRPVNGGLVGAAAAGVPMIIFTNPNVGFSPFAVVLTAAIGFAAPFFYLKRRKDAHYRAWNRELKYLREKIDAPRP
jgi:hypothetical protein